jgi:hypothetical protein
MKTKTNKINKIKNIKKTEEQKQKDRENSKKYYDKMKLINDIINQDTCGKGWYMLEADGNNEYVGRLFNYKELWF